MTFNGFQTFAWISNIVGMPLDQVNFLLVQITALLLAGLLRGKLHPSKVSAETRHLFGLVIGIFFGYFCFGNKAIHIIALPLLCYIPICILSPSYVQTCVMVISLVYLSCLHLYRQIYEYNSYNLDITGPIMVLVQRTTSVAFSIHDGLARKPEELSELQKYQAITKIPTALEFFSYCLNFKTLMAGPIIYYRDYIDFINGTNFYKWDDKNGNKNRTSKIEDEPSAISAVIKKVAMSTSCLLIMFALNPIYPMARVKDEEFLKNTSMLYKFWYLNIATNISRMKYFFAWIFADAICNNAGLGFNGYDENNKPKWDLISNVDAIKLETSTNLREAIAVWNKGTNRWLRSLVYERVNRYSTVYTYALSAIWHGFYPGYYLTFANGALFTFSARAVRRHIRPYFQGSSFAKSFYDFLTMLTTRIFLTYLAFSFVLLEFYPSINVYLHLYLIPHLLGIAAIVFLPLLPKKQQSKIEIQPTKAKTSSKTGESSNVEKRKSQ